MVMPLGSAGSTATGRSATVKTTPLRTFVTPVGRRLVNEAAKGRREKRSCRLRNGPGRVPTIPGGYRLCARKPTVRVENAEFESWKKLVLEKNKAVRAFWTKTYQLKRVAPAPLVEVPVRKVPKTSGGASGSSGLLTTEMKTWAA